MKIKLIAYGFLLVLFAVFMIQNIATVEVKFIIWQASLPRALLLLLTFLLGVGLGVLLPYKIKLKSKAH